MLNRRLLRVKVLQALYAYFQSSNSDRVKAEKELFLSINRIYELYLYLLRLPLDLLHAAELKLDESKSKRFPSEHDLQESNNFTSNRLIRSFEEHEALNSAIAKNKISWDAEHELVSKLFRKINELDAFEEYISKSKTTFEEDRDFLIKIFKSVVFKTDLIEHAFNERSIYWNPEEFDFVANMVLQTIKKVQESDAKDFELTPMYKDEEDDTHFVRNLFRETIARDDENASLIAEKTKNWEVERIAVLDILMMKMAITELVSFRSIPVKVTLNEYIEISKSFSSPKSKVFINGVLDKIVPELKENKLLVKTGRGLIE